MEVIMGRKLLIWPLLLVLGRFNVIHVCGKYSPPRTISDGHDHDALRRMQAFKGSVLRHDSVVSPPASLSPSPGSSPLPPQNLENAREYLALNYGADSTGKSDSTEALLRALADAANGSSEGFLIEDIANLGGAQINLQGGNYLISQPLRFPTAGLGNVMIYGGSLRASDNFTGDGYLIDLSPGKDKNSKSEYNYEYITLKDLFLDSNYKGGGISVINSLRINIDNCYITHFTSNGILVKRGHETYIRNTFIGQHITAGGDKGEKNFSGTGISLLGNDNAITDVVIFSAAIGIMVTGQANILSGVHCYNKATGFGGTGIYLKMPGLTQTRIVHSYMDYTSIVAEDPVQLHISSSFFLGDANIVLKSIKGVVKSVNIVDNMFSGSDKGVHIVHLDQSKGPFKQVEQVVVERNNARGMKIKTTAATAQVPIQGTGTSWSVDFNNILLFPDMIKNVQYSFTTTGNTFPSHALRNVSQNRVVIETTEAVSANIYVAVDQGH